MRNPSQACFNWNCEWFLWELYFKCSLRVSCFCQFSLSVNYNRCGWYDASLFYFHVLSLTFVCQRLSGTRFLNRMWKQWKMCLLSPLLGEGSWRNIGFFWSQIKYCNIGKICKLLCNLLAWGWENNKEVGMGVV